MRNRKTAALCLAAMLLAFAAFAEAPEASEPKPAERELRTPDLVLEPEVRLVGEEGAGKRYQVGEHVVCVMEGTPEEMGYQHGRLLAPEIHQIMKEGYTVRALYDRGYTKEHINAQSVRMEKHFPAEYIAEMQGIVKGCHAAGFEDVTYEEARAGATMAEIMHHGPDAPPGCSNFAVWGQWTTDGRLLHGRNLDWDVKSGAQECAAILVWRPRGGTPYMMVGWAGGVGSVSGMSADGITIGEMTSSSTDETFDGLPLFLIMRRVIEKGRTLDGAVKIMQQGPRTTGWNFIIGDGKIPDGRALEVDAVDCEVFAPMDVKEGPQTGHWAMEDAVRRTNHPIGLKIIYKLVELHGPRFGIEKDNLEAAIPLLQMQNTWQRYDWLGKQIQARPGKVDVRECLQLLGNGPVYNSVTLHSFVFDPKNQTAYVAIAGTDPVTTATNRAFTKIDLSPWFQ